MIWLLAACSTTTASGPLEQMRQQPVVLTRHGACRMECRKISEAEVNAILATGTWIPERTRTDMKCPTHAVEGPDDEGGPLRIVFAACPHQTKVVTAIDLDDAYPDCKCD